LDSTVILILVFTLILSVVVVGFFLVPELLGVSKRDSGQEKDQAEEANTPGKD
jgi:hypothetical protein